MSFGWSLVAPGGRKGGGKGEEGGSLYATRGSQNPAMIHEKDKDSRKC